MSYDSLTFGVLMLCTFIYPPHTVPVLNTVTWIVLPREVNALPSADLCGSWMRYSLRPAAEPLDARVTDMKKISLSIQMFIFMKTNTIYFCLHIFTAVNIAS